MCLEYMGHVASPSSSQGALPRALRDSMEEEHQGAVGGTNPYIEQPSHHCTTECVGVGVGGWGRNLWIWGTKFLVSSGNKPSLNPLQETYKVNKTYVSIACVPERVTRCDL
ncbi:leucine-rich repeat and fibronectin type III domain-containing protein 1-like protein [Platysternon megacephalum]|uniref:Leucine-rich repeat and fibronectin type III domain-containing protein 1-like protein n=1 Tax=Platysternon megacephalum TaxID=55544 RepID=A0A4D9DRC1_9SAUR|nr:leucine-rich repeat and fibronectin type III domain-containing protein 1-like protein [Platysternon megacephalum]